MADSNNSTSSPASSAWYTQQWLSLCEVLDVSDPAEVVPRVQTLKQQMDRLDARPRSSGDGFVTMSEVEDVFNEMAEKMKTFRQRNAASAQQRAGNTQKLYTAYQDLSGKIERLLDDLDATTLDEARQRIDTLNSRLHALYQEKEHLLQAGFSNAKEALDALADMQEECKRLRSRCERLQAEYNRLQAEHTETDQGAAEDTTPDPDTSVLEAAVAIRDTIGVTSPEEAAIFHKVIEKMYERLRAHADALGVDTDEPSGNVLDLLHSMARLLKALPDPEDLSRSRSADRTDSPVDIGSHA